MAGRFESLRDKSRIVGKSRNYAIVGEKSRYRSLRRSERKEADFII